MSTSPQRTPWRALRAVLFLASVLGACADAQLASRSSSLETGGASGFTGQTGGSAGTDPGDTDATPGFRPPVVRGPVDDAGAPAPPTAAPTDAPSEPPPPLVFRVTSPERGARLFGRSIHVEGTLTGGTAPVLEVGGVPTQPSPDGHFSADVSALGGLNILVTTVQDRSPDGPVEREDRRAVLQDADADPLLPVEDGAAVLVAASAFPKISALISDYVRSMDLESMAHSNLPGNVRLLSLTYSRIVVDLIPQEGKIEVRLAVHGMHVELEADVNIYVTDVTVTGNASADPALIVGHLTAQATPEGGLALDLIDSSVDLQNFDYGIDSVPGFIEDWFNGMVRDFAQDTIQDALNDFVLPSLFDPSALQRTVEILGHGIDVGVLLGDVEVHASGLTLRADTLARADAVVHEGAAVRPTGGSPSLEDSHDLDVAASADLASRVLHAAWAAGVLDLTLDENSGLDTGLPLTLALLGNPLGEAANGLDRTAPLVLTLRPLLPPVAHLERTDHPLVIETGDLLIDIGTAEAGTLATVALHFIARTTFDVDSIADGAQVELTPDLDVEVHADVAETPRGPVKEQELETLVETLLAALPAMVAGQTFAFGTDALPVPVRLVNPELVVDDFSPHLHLRADIEQ